MGTVGLSPTHIFWPLWITHCLVFGEWISQQSRKKCTDLMGLTIYQSAAVCVCACTHMHACMLNRVHLFATPWTVAHQAPLSMGFSRQEQWSGLTFSPSGDRATGAVYSREGLCADWPHLHCWWGWSPIKIPATFDETSTCVGGFQRFTSILTLTL